MPENIDIDPAVLRQLASQHDQVAADTKEWAKQPEEWLKAFPQNYGTIADPVHKALLNYYGARERAGLQLAAEHTRIAETLRYSADTFENADRDLGSNIKRAGDGPDSNGSPHVGPLPLNGGGPVAPNAAPAPGSRPGDAPATTGAPGSSNGAPTGTGPANGRPSGLPDSGTPDSRVAASSTNGTSAPVSSAAPAAPTTPVSAASGTVLPPPVTSGPGVGGFGGMLGDDRSSTAATANGQPPMVPPMPVPTPFAAAVARARDKDAEPDYVLGNGTNDDLIVARTLLQSVLAAVDAEVGMGFAVSVMRGSEGIGVFITSNEGRGWLPAGLYLPREVSTPWLWDEMLGETSGSPWEGIADPARVLVEFGMVWGPKANATLSALVSSGPIDPGLRAQLPEVAVAGMVGPADIADLRQPGVDMSDRLGIAGTMDSLKSAASVADSALRARRTELALDAHTRVGRNGAPAVEAVEARRLREQILALAQAEQPVPHQLWEDLRDADGLLMASMLSLRVDVGRVDVGALRIDDEVSALRALVFERRCNELVLMLGAEATRQTLRDAVYAHEQIVGHSKFVELPAAVAAAETTRETGVAVDAGAVTAPGVTTGPPAGVITAPVVTPPNGS
ncbi:type VII secretion target [Nocardia altamirensis]|uniref:type VII secretion target n=1 Tax=Nocardia altamirensis TaxID=472158 RepID=UPI0008404454|nr:type VII secretion target [Nocardia altamirensis]